MIVCGLNKPEMKIEIEVTALRRLVLSANEPFSLARWRPGV